MPCWSTVHGHDLHAVRLANLSSLAIMIGVLSVMVPLPHHVIACVLCLACHADQMGSPGDGKLHVGGLVKSAYRHTVDHQCCVAYLINNIMFFYASFTLSVIVCYKRCSIDYEHYSILVLFHITGIIPHYH